MQSMLVGLIVVACGLYATWILMPLVVRNWVRRVVLRRAPKAADGCGACDSCGPAVPRDRTTPQVVKVVRRR